MELPSDLQINCPLTRRLIQLARELREKSERERNTSIVHAQAAERDEIIRGMIDQRSGSQLAK